MVVNILNSISNSIRKMGQDNGQFRQVAAQQNSSISRFIRDISKFFGSQSRQQSELSNSIGDLQQTTMQTSQRVNQTNDLLQESISVQTQMLAELRNVSKGISNLLNLAGATGGADGTGGGIGGFIGGLVGGAALTAGLGAAAMSMTGGLGDLSGMLGNSSGVGFSDTGGNRDNGGGGKLSVGQMVQLAKEAGFSEQEAVIMGAIGAAESSGITSAHNPDASTGDNSYGLWQINMLGKLEQERKQLFGISENEQLKDPKINAAAAKKIYEQQGFNAWSVYKSGAYRKYLGTAQQSLSEKDDASAPAGTMVQQEGPMGSGAVLEKQRELAGIRKLPLSTKLRSVLDQAAASVGVQAIVYSGGQAPKGSGGPRTGSTRHDHGNAADLYLVKDGRKLSDTNPEDRAIMAKFVSAAVSAGATGVGAGHGYMGPSNIHVGFGNPATWGGAPWIQSAAAGITNNQDLSSEGGGYQTAGGDSYGGGLDPLSALLGANMGMMSSGLESLIGAVMGGGPMGMISGLLPAPAIAGFGGMLASLGGALSGSNKQDPKQAAEIEENLPEEKVEADDSGAMIAQLKDRSSDYIQNMAVQNESIRFAGMSQQQTPTAAPQHPNIADGFRTNQDLYRTGAPNSPSWYQQLAGRISYDESMKLRGGVLA